MAKANFELNEQLTRLWKNFGLEKMRKYVKCHILAHDECLLTTIPAGKQPEDLHAYPTPKRPLERVHVNHIGTLVRTEWGNTLYWFWFSHWPLLCPKNSQNCRKHNEVARLFDMHGIQIVTDRGTCFTSNECQHGI